MARPTKLTAEIIVLLCEQLRKGKTKRAASGHVGVHRDTLKEWENRGRQARGKHLEGGALNDAEELYLELLLESELALAQGESWLIDMILDAAGGEKSHLKKWQAYMTLLERTRPDDWRRRSSAEYVERDKTPAARLNVSKLNLEERESLRELLKKASGGE
ncbi:MAG TPA: hypothetical protein VIL92_06195 [Gaiellaceae bacterium]|jgi:hypothetical protein